MLEFIVWVVVCILCFGMGIFLGFWHFLRNLPKTLSRFTPDELAELADKVSDEKSRIDPDGSIG